jgi:hypothetical protein
MELLAVYGTMEKEPINVEIGSKNLGWIGLSGTVCLSICPASVGSCQQQVV